MRPSVGCSIKFSNLSNVDFPEPLLPTIPVTDPDSIVKEKSFIAKLSLYFFETCQESPNILQTRQNIYVGGTCWGRQGGPH